MTDIQQVLYNYINSSYKLYKYANLKEIDKLKENYYKSRTDRNRTNKYPLVKYIIKNQELSVSVDWNEKILEKDDVLKEEDKRIEHIYNMINNTIKYALKKNKPVPDTELYIWLSDRVPWYNNIDKRFPIYVFSKPINTQFILFPDNTFDCMTQDAKYSTQCSDWDDTKKSILKKAMTIDYDDKKDKVFFKGTATGQYHTNIRDNLNKSSADNTWLSIKLDGWSSYMPMEQFCEYKILINLPGHYPWSNRFKYLFLMKSLVINVDVFSIDTENAEFEPEWTTFINLLVEPDKHYLNIIMKYYYSSDKNEKIKNIQLNYDSSQYVLKELKNIYENRDNEKYQKIISNGYETISKLNNSDIYEYIYECIIHNSKVNFI
jgi:hypothetical protein